jgi:hypothetical protein
MGCRICGRNACIESFHSLAEQERYEEIDGRLVLKQEEKEETENDHKRS